MTLVLIPPGSAADGGPVLLDDDEQHHLKVRRVPAGSDVAFTDGAGVRGTGSVVAHGRAFALAIGSVEQVAAPAPLVLAVGAGDRDRFGWLVEKATELGVTEIVPLETERTRGVATGLKPEQLDKLRRRAREVLKQCGGAWVPGAARSPAVRARSCSVPTRERDGCSMRREALRRRSTRRQPPAPWWDPREDSATSSEPAALAHGFIPVLAGPLTLRFETAAIAAAVLIQASRHR